MKSLYDAKVTSIDGKEVSLKDFKGKVLLIVNTASKCGFTPQYKDLESIYESYRDKGLVVLGFPCNQFGSQEPGSEAEIGAFCEKNYGVSFPMFSKVEVNGEQAHPVYKFLKPKAKGILGSENIKWNFTKFLVDRSGQVVDRYAPMTSPKKLTSDIEKLL